MAANWTIVNSTHGRAVTCQKPILIQMRSTSIQVVHFRCDLQIRALDLTTVDGGWTSLDLNICAYPDAAPISDTTTYTVNFSDYCRNYFHLSEQVLKDTYCLNNNLVDPVNLFMPSLEDSMKFNYMFQREFRARIWPVLIDSEGSYFEEYDNNDYCKEFMCFNLNTKNGETTSSVYTDNIRIDQFVNGYCVGANNNSNTYGLVSYNTDRAARLLTNMPGVAASGQVANGPYNTINIRDTKIHWVGYGWNFNVFEDGDHIRKHIWTIRNASTGVENTYSIESDSLPPWTQTNPTDIGWLYLNPVQLQFCFDTHEIGDNSIIDNSGDLVADRVTATVEFHSSVGMERRSPSITVNWTDKINDGNCRRTRFVFMNMRGHLDWFHCYGTVKKSVSVSGSTYERLTTMDRGVNDSFNRMKPAHQNQNLQTSRKDEYSVFSQPLTTDWAEWLQELITSPMVWIDEFRYGTETNIFNPNNSTLITPDNVVEVAKPHLHPTHLVPIIIDKSSFDIYTTEDNVHYIEFKYVKSNEITTQKGY